MNANPNINAGSQNTVKPESPNPVKIPQASAKQNKETIKFRL